MVKGYIYNGEIRRTLFPEIRPAFERYFVDRSNMKIKNVDMFINRCYGLCSHYGSLYTNKSVKKTESNKKSKLPRHRSLQREGYPTEYELKIENIHMSSEQFSRYDSARDREKEETALGLRSDEYERFSKKSGSTTYRIASRQISNYVIPMYALGQSRGKKAREKFIDKITDNDLRNLDVQSPKFKKILENIRRHSGIAVVYSDFVTGEGIDLFARTLNVYGYSEWKISDLNNITAWKPPKITGSNEEIGHVDIPNTWEYTDPDIIDVNETQAVECKYSDESEYGNIYFGSDENKIKTNGMEYQGIERALPFNDIFTGQYGGYIDEMVFYGGKQNRYARLTGKLDVDDRTKLLDYFNNPKNMRGDLIKILLISGAGSEGISIANARSIHIMHPYWNIAKIDQVKARAIRYKSHDMLPLTERNVQPYIYLSNYPKDYDKLWEEKQLERLSVGLKREKLERPTDMELYHKSLRQKRLNDYFLAAAIRGSIDCSLHVKSLPLREQKRINCLICNPTNKNLYHPLINTQIVLDNPCGKYKKENIKAKEIKVDMGDGVEETFYYMVDPEVGVVLFIYDKNME
jgi:hypothetical protein